MSGPDETHNCSPARWWASAVGRSGGAILSDPRPAVMPRPRQLSQASVHLKLGELRFGIQVQLRLISSFRHT
jgi:hypothetical protein